MDPHATLARKDRHPESTTKYPDVRQRSELRYPFPAACLLASTRNKMSSGRMDRSREPQSAAIGVGRNRSGQINEKVGALSKLDPPATKHDQRIFRKSEFAAQPRTSGVDQ